MICDRANKLVRINTAISWEENTANSRNVYLISFIIWVSKELSVFQTIQDDVGGNQYNENQQDTLITFNLFQ